MDVENIILKFNKKEIRSDGNWDELVEFLKAQRQSDLNAQASIRVFPVDVTVEKRQ